jgi:hypothetical protein
VARRGSQIETSSLSRPRPDGSSAGAARRREWAAASVPCTSVVHINYSEHLPRKWLWPPGRTLLRLQ